MTCQRATQLASDRWRVYTFIRRNADWGSRADIRGVWWLRAHDRARRVMARLMAVAELERLVPTLRIYVWSPDVRDSLLAMESDLRQVANK